MRDARILSLQCIHILKVNEHSLVRRVRASKPQPQAWLERAHEKSIRVSTVTQVNRDSTSALRRSALDFCLGGQRSCKEDPITSQDQTSP